MNRVLLLAVSLLLFLPTGCGNRQRANRIIFVASAPLPAATAGPAAAGVLTVVEPQTEEPEEAPKPLPPEPTERPAARPRIRLAPPGASTESEPEAETVPAVEVPLLEPQGGPGEQAQQRQVRQFQNQVRGRIARQEKVRLSADDQRMLDDARTFLAQSERALATRDFPRARTLALKASMLLAVIEQQ